MPALLVLFVLWPVLGGFGCPPRAAIAADGGRSAPAAAATSDRNLVASPPSRLPGEHVYEVHKKVSDFPDREDLSTPEAASATIHRAYAAKGDAAWLPLSLAEVVARVTHRGFQPIVKGPVPPGRVAASYLSAEILEVHTWNQDHAVIIARMPRKGHDIDYRSPVRVNGRWLAVGDYCRGGGLRHRGRGLWLLSRLESFAARPHRSLAV